MFDLDKDEMRAKELEKYVKLYSQTDYGNLNHGKEVFQDFRFKRNLLEEGIYSILDAGCGGGSFIKDVYNLLIHQSRGRFEDKVKEIKLVGLDFASIPEEGIVFNDNIQLMRGDVCSLPFEDGSFDIVTCFDVLEHLLEFDVLVALKELKRVAKRELYLKPSYRESHGKGVEGEDLHPTVKHESWWIEQIESVGVESVERIYHIGDDDDPKTSVLHVIL